MRELALHILDLVQNSVEAGASRVDLEIAEDTHADRLTIRVRDNGRGMKEELRRQATDPFVTTRRTRKIGLGLPLIDMSTRHCDGRLNLVSTPGQGTSVEAVWRFSHLDRPPLGDMSATVRALVAGNPELALVYRHWRDGREFILSTDEIAGMLGPVPLSISSNR